MTRHGWHTMILTAALTAWMAPAWAQSVDPALQKAAEARAAARDAGDAESYGRYILEDAVITNSNGVMVTRASRMKAVAGNPLKTPRPKVSDEKYRMFGDAAIRTWREDGPNADRQNVGTRWIEVWVKQKGEWKLASLQFTNIQTP